MQYTSIASFRMQHSVQTENLGGYTEQDRQLVTENWLPPTLTTQAVRYTYSARLTGTNQLVRAISHRSKLINPAWVYPCILV